MSGLPATSRLPADSTPVRREALKRIPELDALRGLAAVGILALHTLYPYFFWAWSCVDLFFILSGFLISSILLQLADRPRALLPFYIRRALRIWPVYYIAWLAVAVIFVVSQRMETGQWQNLPDGQWISLVFLQYVEHYGFGSSRDYLWYFDHSWSLAVEEQFYLLWPLAFLFLRPSGRWLLAAGLVLLLGSLFFRAQGGYIHVLGSRIDGLLFGILLAYAVNGPRPWLHRVPWQAFALVALSGALLLAPYLLSRGRQTLFFDGERGVEVLAFCLVWVAVVGVCIQRSGVGWLAALRSPILVHVGRLSFAIYMYQVPLAFLSHSAVAAGHISENLGRVLIWLATFACAQLSYRWIEQHALALKARFPYRSAADG